MALSDILSGVGSFINTPFVKDVAVPGLFSLYQQNQLQDNIGKAGQQVQQGLRRGLGSLDEQYAYGAGQLEPYQAFGLQGLGGYQELMSDPSQITSDPGYEFRFGEGQRALERSAAAKGMGLSGNTLAGLTQYGQQFAMDEYDRALARRAAQIETGLRGAGTLADLSEAYGRGVAGLYGEMGSTAGATTIGQGQAERGGLGDILDMYQSYRRLKTVAGGNDLVNKGLDILGLGSGSVAPGISLSNLGSAASGFLGGGSAALGTSAAGGGGAGLTLGSMSGTAPGLSGLGSSASGYLAGESAALGGGSSAAAAGGTIGALGALGIGAGIIGVGKLSQALTADKDRVGQLYEQFQKSPEQGYNFLEGIITGERLDNNRPEIGKPLKWALDSGITDFTAPVWHGKDARFDIWGEAKDKPSRDELREMSPVARREAEREFNLSEYEMQSFTPYLYGRNPEEQQIIKDLQQEISSLESEDFSDIGGAGSWKARARDQNLEEAQKQLAQYVNPQRKRQRAQEIYNQLKGKGYDLTKLENYLGM